MKPNAITRVESGFSLVELMVGVLIALIAVLMMAQIGSTAEAQKRGATGSGDAQMSGALAIFSIQREGSNAGYGTMDEDILGCQILQYNKNWTAPFQVRTLSPIRPIEINPAGIPAADPGTDVIRFTYSESNIVGKVIEFKQPTETETYQVADRNASGLKKNDFVLVWRPNLPAPGGCPVIQITDLPTDVGKELDVVASSTDSEWNKSGGFGLGCNPCDGKFISLGSALHTIYYAVRGGVLTRCDGSVSDCSSAAAENWRAVADNVINLRAEYGKDTSATTDYTVDEYNATPPVTTCDWTRVLAVRVAILTRNPSYEKEILTTDVPTWTSGSGAAVSFQTDSMKPGVDEWQHYRYQVLQTALPIKNTVWYERVNCL